MLDMNAPEPATRVKAKELFRYEKDLGKKDENTGHVGQFSDIVKGEGHEDYEAWQRNTKDMSEEEKVEEYNKFKNFADSAKSNNNGYSKYIHSKQYAKDH
jgi:hypothetical protein